MSKRAGPRYAIIPADAVTDERLSGADLKVLALLGRHIDKRGWCVRSQSRMAVEIRLSVKTLQRSLARLVQAGFVEISHERRRDGGQAANCYRVVLDEEARAAQLDLFSGSPPASEAKLTGGVDTPPPASEATIEGGPEISADAVLPARSAGQERDEDDAPPTSFVSPPCDTWVSPP